MKHIIYCKKGSGNIEDIQKAPGIKGMLNSFANIVMSCESRSSIAFIGIPYTCTPLVDFFVYVVRDMCEKKYYIPESDFKTAYELYLGKHRVEARPANIEKVDIVVILGGLAMPEKWEIEEVKGAIEILSHEGTTIVGACFMDIFKKAGWVKTIPFDYVENSYLSTDAYKNNFKDE
ncbi:MAG: DUF2124 family protein [Candidatus Methanofastidiosa archaeon]|nr:DUF2124 family protein [Candidatus Methanofastidiosa archaeon]